MLNEKALIMKSRITTETGSTYIIDIDNKRWERVVQTDESGKIRKDSGDIIAINNYIIGSSLIITGSPLSKGS